MCNFRFLKNHIIVIIVRAVEMYVNYIKVRIKVSNLFAGKLVSNETKEIKINIIFLYQIYFIFLYTFIRFFFKWCNLISFFYFRLNLAIPRAAPGEGDKAFTYSQCVRYDVNFTELLENGTLDLVPNPNWPVRPCDQGWEFDFSEIPYASITAEVRKNIWFYNIVIITPVLKIDKR